MKQLSKTERPESTNSQEEFVHWESDSVIVLRETREVLDTELERKARFVRTRKLPQKTSVYKQKVMIKIWKDFPKESRKARLLIMDQGFVVGKKIPKN